MTRSYKMLNFQLELTRSLARDLVNLYQWKRCVGEDLQDWIMEEIERVRKEHKKARIRSKAYLFSYKRERGLI